MALVPSTLLLAPTCFAQVEGAGAIKILAEDGNPSAQYRLGEQYLAGFYYADALRWFRAAAEKGVVAAQWRLGQMYLDGLPAFPQRSAKVPADLKQGIYWLRQAAAAGHTQAQTDLGKCYESGKGVTKNTIEAYKWFGIAAKNGAIVAKTYRDELALKMSTEQIAEAAEQVEAFKPGAKPGVWQDIQLKGLSGTAQKRFALINTATVAEGETFTLSIGGERVTAKCEKIREDSVILSVGNQVRVVALRGGAE